MGDFASAPSKVIPLNFIIIFPSLFVFSSAKSIFVALFTNRGNKFTFTLSFHFSKLFGATTCKSDNYKNSHKSI